MNSLQHLFATGVRFDTEVQYLVAASSGKAADSPGIGRASSYYRNLPLKPRAHEHPSDGAGVTALQCAAVVHQCEPRRIRGSFLPNPCNEAQLQEALQKRFPRLRLEVHVCDAAQNVGAMAR